MIYVIIGIVVLLLIFLAVAGHKCIEAMIHPKVWDREHEFTVLPKWGYDVRAFYESLRTELFEFASSRGYNLQCEEIPPEEGISFPDGRERAVLLIHGYTANRVTALSYAELYHRLGFRVFIYDQRFHGSSGGDCCTMGYLESKDAVDLMEYLRTRLPENTLWGISGESMGAATSMMAAAQLPWLSFAAEDSGYATLREEIAASIRYKTKFPPHPIAEIAAVLYRQRVGVPVSAVQPEKAVGNIQVPMLFTHGSIDKFVPTKMVYRVFNAKPGDNKRMHVFEDVPHAKSTLMRHEEYMQVLREFLTDFGII